MALRTGAVHSGHATAAPPPAGAAAAVPHQDGAPVLTAVVASAAGIIVGAALAPVAERFGAAPATSTEDGPANSNANGNANGSTTIGRGVAAVVTGATFAAIVLALGINAALPTYLYLAAAGVVLARVDLRVNRLPNAIVLPSYPVTGLALVAASWASEDWQRLARAGLAAAAVLAGFLALALLASLGLGDVKLAGLLALATGWLSWTHVAVFVLSAFGIGAGWAILRILRGHARSSYMPFGPALLAGALTAVLVL
jgi:leader peptidase (prepilin peptidase)/N-methyltransferase